MGYGMMGGYGFGLLGLIFNVAIIVGLIWLVVWAVRRFANGAPGASSAGATPRDIVQARYARGEITREQYREMLQDLS